MAVTGSPKVEHRDLGVLFQKFRDDVLSQEAATADDKHGT